MLLLMLYCCGVIRAALRCTALAVAGRNTLILLMRYDGA